MGECFLSTGLLLINTSTFSSLKANLEGALKYYTVEHMTRTISHVYERIIKASLKSRSEYNNIIYRDHTK